MHQRLVFKLAMPLLLIVGLSSIPALLAGCGKGKEQSSRELSADTPIEDRRLALRSNLTEMQVKMAELEEKMTDLQRRQTDSLESVVKSTQQLNKDFAELKAEALSLSSGELVSVPTEMLQPGTVTAPASEPAAEPIASKSDGLSPLPKLIVWVIVIVAIGILVRMFIGRKDEEFEDYDLADQPVGDIKQTEYGTIQVPPGVKPESPAASTVNDDIEHPDKR